MSDSFASIEMLFTHVINPYAAPAGSEAERTQKITFAALRAAIAEAADHKIGVELLAIGEERDASAVEPPARPLPSLTRTVRDVATLQQPLPFPLLVDVLESAAKQGTGEYLIFTNMDICPQRYFYRTLAEMIQRAGGGEQAFVIPRRTIPATFTSADDLPKMYAERGIGHEGFDCFVFPRRWVEKLDLGTLCLGTPDFDLSLILNLEVLSGFKTRVLWEQFLTFHLGDDKAWAERGEINAHNHSEALAVLARLETKIGRPPPPRSKFIYARVWLTHQPPPAASKPHIVAQRLRQELAQFKNRWLVRRFRRAQRLAFW